MGWPNLPLTLHKFLYANDNPVNQTDPSGRSPLLELLVTQFNSLVNRVRESKPAEFLSRGFRNKIADVYLIIEPLDPAFAIPSPLNGFELVHTGIFVNVRQYNVGIRYDIGPGGRFLRQFRRLGIPNPLNEARFTTVFDGVIYATPAAKPEIEAGGGKLIGPFASFNYSQFLAFNTAAITLGLVQGIDGLTRLNYTFAGVGETYNCFKWTAEAAALAITIQVLPLPSAP